MTNDADPNKISHKQKQEQETQQNMTISLLKNK